MSKILIIINPAAGKKDSILWSLNNAFQKKDISWEIMITKEKDDAYQFAKDAVEKKIGIVAVYGGDGTIAEVARALFKTQTALFIIPGGTANVFAKELSIPIDTDQALAILSKSSHTIKSIDMGLFQKKPFVLRIEAGLAAHIVKDTKRTTKRLVGQLSYLVHSFSHLQTTRKYHFTLTLDGKHISESGIALMIANVGNIGVEGYSVVPQSNITDGMLDVAIIKEKGIGSLLSWIQSTIKHTKPIGAISSWKAKKVTVLLTREQTIICDDMPLVTKQIEAEIVPHALRVITA